MSNALDLEAFKEEFIDGKVYYMSPSANPKHGRAIGNIYFVFKSYLRGKRCQVFTDTIDVYLDAEKKDKVIPDVSILCDETKFTDKGYEGVPSLVVEVISPTSVKRDRKIKFNIYEKYKVQEYWIVDPINKVIEQYILIDGKYSLEGTYVKLEEWEKERLSQEEKSKFSESFKTSIFSELAINVEDIFE
jgi:Uma2 family endonuclease